MTMTNAVSDKTGREIAEGDTVMTRFRGGKREGQVEEIVVTQTQAKEAGVKNPPKVLDISFWFAAPRAERYPIFVQTKVLFTDQHGHDVAHNPQTLTVVESEDQK
ncbi:hypothetical protein MPER_10918 [Moniliophthora perniciosa FA553]|nr:hypothetical protein MPER_10918 [Moniliophthora perniciosa FA553]